MRIIYDVGANNGDDIPYYLLKADLVVAVEANPALTDLVRERFADAIAARRLVVESCVVTAEPTAAEVPFFLSPGNNLVSQLAPPADAVAGQFERTLLPARRLIEVVAQYGEPYYVKLDVEGHDHLLLNDLFRYGVRPPYISAEAHTVNAFAALVANGGYRAFKIVDGASVPVEYGDHAIDTAQGPRRYAFPNHSAGPFGNDVNGPWLDGRGLLHRLAAWDLGWRDIHASAVDEPGEA